jgi:hypothetical protein
MDLKVTISIIKMISVVVAIKELTFFDIFYEMNERFLIKWI